VSRTVLAALLLLAWPLGAAAEERPISPQDRQAIEILLLQRQLAEARIETVVLRAQMRLGLKDWQIDLIRWVWISPPAPDKKTEKMPEVVPDR